MVRTTGRSTFFLGFLAIMLGFYVLTAWLEVGPGVMIVLLGGVLLLYGVITTQ
jgi:drug/metabolite transporter superfamily protein YnfA